MRYPGRIQTLITHAFVKSNAIACPTAQSEATGGGKKNSRAHGHSPYEFQYKAGGTIQAESAPVTVTHTVTETGNQFNNSRYHS